MRFFRKILIAIGIRIVGAVQEFLGNLRRLRNQIRGKWPGADPLRASRYEAIYVHYDPHGTLHDYVLEQIRSLVASGFRITFVSNGPALAPADISKVGEFCRQIVWRRNVGHDFGAYKDGIHAIGDLGGIERLLLMNDSVYGPLHPLTELFRAIDPLSTDFWGISDSWEISYHIQSYFMLFLPGALKSSAFREFWRAFPYVNQKRWVIQHGEIGLSQLLIQNKLRPNVLAPYWQVAKVVMEKIARVNDANMATAQKEFLGRMLNLIVQGKPLNPAHHFWETMVADFGCPFIKRDLIMRNPAHIPFTWRWAEIIRRHSDYDTTLIERHLHASDVGDLARLGSLSHQ